MTHAPIQGHYQRGFSLVAAIFIVVALAALGAFMVTLSTLQQLTSSSALQGARAFQAAQSGIEWGVYQALNGAACSASPASTTTGPFGLTVPGLDGFQVTVACSYTEHQEGPPPLYRVFTIGSVATFGNPGDPNFVSRSLVVTVTNAT